MKKFLAIAVGCIALSSVVTSSASAQSLADVLHSQRVEGGRMCLADHFHSGSSSGHATRPQAEAAAASSWSGFTAWEYGNQWGSWRIAASRSANCQQSGSGWGCDVEARPCRPLAGRAGPAPRSKGAQAKAKRQAAAKKQ